MLEKEEKASQEISEDSQEGQGAQGQEDPGVKGAQEDQGQRAPGSESSQSEVQPIHLTFKQAIFEKTVSRTAQLNTLDKEQVIKFMDFDGDKQVRTCPGDIYKIVNALMDYSRLLEIAAQEWDIGSYHKAVYEEQARVLRKIANKFSSGIGYDYYQALEKCKKQLERQQKKGSDDIGVDALAVAVERGQRKQRQKGEKA